MTIFGLLAAALLAALAAPPPLHQTSGRHSPPPTKAPLAIIDVNKASAEEFAQLPGIGPKLAERIVKYRTKHGPFRRVEDLLAIRGIGHKKWKELKPYLRLGPGRARADLNGRDTAPYDYRKKSQASKELLLPCAQAMGVAIRRVPNTATPQLPGQGWIGAARRLGYPSRGWYWRRYPACL